MTGAESLIGSVIGERYAVTGTLGEGGMGTVLRVEHVVLGRPFALKTLRIGERAEELVTRFEREARALAQVRSPRVAQVTDFGVDPNVGPWYVMELVDGVSLHDRLEHGPLAMEEVVRLGIALCEALDDVHSVGIVHRDLKPSNIGLTTGGPVPLKLLDFGLAAAIDESFLSRITQSQQVLGSLPYIAPEVFQGARPGTSLDLWSLGIVLYEMATAKLPFEAPSTAALMHQILTSPVPRTESFPAPIAAAVRALLTKDPRMRVASARDAAALLRGDGPSTLRGVGEEPVSLPPTIERALQVPDLTQPHTPTPVPPTIASEIPLPPLPAPAAAAGVRSETANIMLPRPRWGLWVTVGLMLSLLTAAAAAATLQWRSGGNHPQATAPPAIAPIATGPSEPVETEVAPPVVEDAGLLENEERPESGMRTVPSVGSAVMETGVVSMETTLSMGTVRMGSMRPRMRETMVVEPTMTEAEMTEMTAWMGEVIDTPWRGGIIEDP